MTSQRRARHCLVVRSRTATARDDCTGGSTRQAPEAGPAAAPGPVGHRWSYERIIRVIASLLPADVARLLGGSDETR